MIDKIYLIRYNSMWDGSPWVIFGNYTRGMYVGDSPIALHNFSMSKEDLPGPSTAVLMEIERV
jgi:hypothetical protein